MAEELIALFEKRKVGRVILESGRLSFHYDEEWRSSELQSFPLSLSMPLIAAEHGHAPTHAFLWGLLPDNERVLDRWASRFHVSARNPFALIANVGEDCAGAVQFVRPERLQKLRNQIRESVVWLTEEEVAERLIELRRDHSAWRLPGDTGQFSLAGAQPKTALLYRDGRWGIPSGRTPSTHILKPPLLEWKGHAENEHFCLELAATLGLVASKSSVRRFGDEVAIVIERYDRVSDGPRIERRHQEDTCQALAIPPTRKYENDGGPSIRDIVGLVRAQGSHPREDVGRFLDAVMFNWLIAGTDAHAKNYSVLMSFERSVRLAPLYDVASILPYPGVQIPKLKMPMKIGGEYRLRQIGIRQWRKLANEVRVDEDELVQRLRTLAEEIPDHTSKLRSEVRDHGLAHPLIDRLADAITKRARSCAELLKM